MSRNCFTFEINTAVSFFNNVGFQISDYRSIENATKVPHNRHRGG
jgi:hypothetical protein